LVFFGPSKTDPRGKGRSGEFKAGMFYEVFIYIIFIVLYIYKKIYEDPNPNPNPNARGRSATMFVDFPTTASLITFLKSI